MSIEKRDWSTIEGDFNIANSTIAGITDVLCASMGGDDSRLSEISEDSLLSLIYRCSIEAANSKALFHELLQLHIDSRRGGPASPGTVLTQVSRTHP